MRHAILAFWFGAACVAAPPADGIRLPAAPSVPSPMPPAGGTTRLVGDSIYVIDSDTPVLVLASPAGVVSVTEDAGPIRVRGRFVDGTGRTESRTYKGKQVFVVEGLVAGRVELLIVPVGAKTEGEVVRRLLDVEGGTGPQPPPDPKIPDPKPADPVVDAALLKKFQIAYDADPAADKVASLAAFARAMARAEKTASDATLTTVGALERRVNVDALAEVGRGKLPALGVAAGEYLSARLPASREPVTPLTAELRAAAADAYARVAATLKAVKP